MTNPNPANITDELWRLWLQLAALAPGSELGGIYANKSGYHNTIAANRARYPGNYSIRDAVDLDGDLNKAAALDWTFPEAQHGNYSRISMFCQRLMASSVDRNDPRLDGLREWYGQTNNDPVVEGWDCRYLRPVTSDTSHLWHIHFSFTRTLVTSARVMDGLLSVLRGETVAQWAGTGAPGVPTEEEIMKPYALLRDPQSGRVFAVYGASGAGVVVRWIGPAEFNILSGVIPMENVTNGDELARLELAAGL